LGATGAEVKRYLDEIAKGVEGNPPDLVRLLLAQPEHDW
jgi:hypothetical protein